MVKQDTVQACNVCLNPVDGRALDVQLGPVCMRCKVELRWAAYWLAQPETQLSHCSNKHHYRIKNLKDK